MSAPVGASVCLNRWLVLCSTQQRVCTVGATILLLFCIVAGVKQCAVDGRRTEYAARQHTDEILVRDADRAETELARRLLAAIKIQDGLLLVRDPIIGDLDLVVMPASASWILHCGVGVTVAFGAGGSDGAVIEDQDGGSTYPAGSAASGIELTLTDVIIDARTCASIAPALGKRIRDTLRGR